MADSESDDSDGEGGLGNVSRVVMRPPGHSGKAKKGHLCFDASFETGNLGKVDLVSDFEYDLYIRPDTCNPYHRIWFNFVVDNTKLDQEAYNNLQLKITFLNFLESDVPYCKYQQTQKFVLRWNDSYCEIIEQKEMTAYMAVQIYSHLADLEMDLQSPEPSSMAQPRVVKCFGLASRNGSVSIQNVVQWVSISGSVCFYNSHPLLPKEKALQKWSRMPSHQVFFYQSPYHDSHYVLTLSFCFDKEEEAYQFAYSYPYSYSKHQAHLENIEQKQLPYFKRDILANSLQKRRIDIVTITNPQNMETPEKIRVVVVFSRIHPGDSPTSYICQGMIDFLISNHPTAVGLRSRVVFKIIPMINPDGVVLGNFRSNWLGSDFERFWSRISPWSHPPLHAAFETISNLNKDKNVELDFVIDLRAHCSLRGIFVHGNTYQNVYRFFSNLKESINCYSIYASFYGYNHKETKKLIYFDEESYYRIGRNIARTFADYYKYLGVISSEPKKMHRKSNKQSNGRIRRKKMAARMVFSKIRKKTYKRRRPPKAKMDVVQEIPVVEMQPKVDVKKGHIDFSNVMFPPISDQKTIKRKLLPARQQSIRNSTLEKDQLRLSSDLKILKIG